MVNRILKILKEENLTASQFADIVEVQRSSMSHILSGRNNPSLDFVNKILKTFPKINTDWLMFGTGNMYDQKVDNIKTPVLEDDITQKKESKGFSDSATLDLFGEFGVQPAKGEEDSVKPETIISENYENMVRSEDPAPYLRTAIKSDNYDTKTPNLASLESNISSQPANNPKIIQPEADVVPTQKKKEIERIVIFYTDKTFSIHGPE
ncbi:MAG: helix-turn-helix transcriptional regulator [Bacteroidota bacterium]